MDRDFEIGGRKFKLNKLDAFKQFHVMRKLAPILSDLLPIAQKLTKQGASDEAYMESLTPIMNGVAKLDDSVAEFILMSLCHAVEIQSQNPPFNYARVSQNGMLMFQDLNLLMLFQIAIKAFMFNMTDFLALTPQISAGQK